MYEIFRKNLGLMTAPATENNTGQGGSINQKMTLHDAQMLTFCKEV